MRDNRRREQGARILVPGVYGVCNAAVICRLWPVISDVPSSEMLLRWQLVIFAIEMRRRQHARRLVQRETTERAEASSTDRTAAFPQAEWSHRGPAAFPMASGSV